MFDVRSLDQNWEHAEVRRLAETLKRLLNGTLDIRSPIVIRNHGSGPVFHVAQMSSGITVIEAVNEEGHEVALGFGMASRGIVANEYVPLDTFAIDALFAQECLRSGDTPDRSGFGIRTSGSGKPESDAQVKVVADWTRGLLSLQRSLDTEHAPNAADKFTRDGQVSWLVRKPSHWHLLRVRIDTINDDTLECTVIANGKVTEETITVAKPCTLQRTPWDGTTYNGVTYTYSDSQTREADDGAYDPVEQVVDPPYDTDSPCPEIYVSWVGNKTDLDGVYWIDVNVDARHWVEA